MATRREPHRRSAEDSPDSVVERRQQIEQNRALIEALRSLREDDDPLSIADQRETLEILKHGLDEARTYRKLFP
jgi:hypothetical protein